MAHPLSDPVKNSVGSRSPMIAPSTNTDGVVRDCPMAGDTPTRAVQATTAPSFHMFTFRHPPRSEAFVPAMW